MKYASIPINARNRVLNEFYFNCWKEFEKAMKEFLQAGAQISNNTKETFNSDIEPPAFNYFPDEGKMIEAIRKLSNTKIF